MAITIKKPKIKQSVGNMYYAFNKMIDEEFNPNSYEGVIKCGNVKTVEIVRNGEEITIKNGNQIYNTSNTEASIDISVETVAFDPEDLARMKGEDITDNGLIIGGAPNFRPYFAFGKVIKKLGGGVRWEWFPMCQLVDNTDDTSTSEGSYSEQNDTVTIRAYSFDGSKHKRTYIDSEMSNFPKGLTENGFFRMPILTKADLAVVLKQRLDTTLNTILD